MFHYKIQREDLNIFEKIGRYVIVNFTYHMFISGPVTLLIFSSFTVSYIILTCLISRYWLTDLIQKQPSVYLKLFEQLHFEFYCKMPKYFPQPQTTLKLNGNFAEETIFINHYRVIMHKCTKYTQQCLSLNIKYVKGQKFPYH